MQQTTEHPTMLHQVSHFIYINIAERVDFIMMICGTWLGIHISQDFTLFALKIFATGFLAVIGTIFGWLAKIFITQPLHKYLKLKYPNSKFFN